MRAVHDRAHRPVGRRAPGTAPWRATWNCAASRRACRSSPCCRAGGSPDYLACADLYAAEGIDLAALPLVGLGSVCRRQSTGEIAAIVAALARRGSGCTASASRPAACTCTATGSRPPTRWRGATPPAACRRCPAAPGTRTALTASSTRPAGAIAPWPATPRADSSRRSSIGRTQHDQLPPRSRRAPDDSARAPVRASSTHQR